MRKARGHRAVAQEEPASGGEEAGEEEEGKTRGDGQRGGSGEIVAARGRRFSRPAAVLRFVREAMECGVNQAG